MTANATAMVIETSVASESMPSMKFTALITPTIQITETTRAEDAEVDRSRRRWRRRRSESRS